MLIPFVSSPAVKTAVKQTDEIHLFMQFYVDENAERQNEIRTSLYKNLANPFIRKVHMLNERIYKNKDFGVKSAKIVQTDIGRRLTYSDIFSYINENDIRGYIIIANSDIFFDNTLENLLYSDIHDAKKIFAQLRYEYNVANPAASPIFGPRCDSQDVWILHTNHGIAPKHEILFDFHMGKPGCDNKIVYIFAVLGYEIVNDPGFIKTYHYHSCQKRNYTRKDVIVSNYGLVFPHGFRWREFVDGVGRYSHFYPDITELPKFSDNLVLYKYILSCFDKNRPFVVPRVAGIENIFAHIGDMWTSNGVTQQSLAFLQSRFRQFKNNAGILVRDIGHIIEYSQRYLKAFQNSELYSGWDKSGGVYRAISESHDYITAKYPAKKMIWAEMLGIFYHIYNTPWTHALRGKRVLVISSFSESIREQLPKRQHLYDGVDLFPECSFVVIQPPQTMGLSDATETADYFGVHLAKFTKQLDDIRDTYDVALVACGGYGNLVCNHIFESGKSAIYVGGVLQMYFGVAGNRWYKDNPEIIEMFLNEYWTRPKESETPVCHQSVEMSCYW